MASVLTIRSELFGRIGGTDVRFGETEDFKKYLSIDGDSLRKKLTVAASGTAVLYDGANDGFATCSWFGVASWYTGVIEVTYDTAGAVGVTYQTHHVVGTGEDNAFGVPFICPDAKAYANYTADFGGGTLYYPDKIEYKNLDSSNATEVVFVCGE